MRLSTSHGPNLDLESDLAFFPNASANAYSNSSCNSYSIDTELRRLSTSPSSSAMPAPNVNPSLPSFLPPHGAYQPSPYQPTSARYQLPVSPPAPHRRAPRPPIYAPRRHRVRHIAMREPAKCGLFTVCEDEAEHASYPARIADVPMDVDIDTLDTEMDVEMIPSLLNEEGHEIDSARRLSWSSSSTATLAESEAVETDTESRGVATPLLEDDDPFEWTEVSLRDQEAGSESESESTKAQDFWQAMNVAPAISFKPEHSPSSMCAGPAVPRYSRRPPPLLLTSRISTSLSRHPFSASSLESDEVITPRSSSCSMSASIGLLPALPVLSSSEWAARTRPRSNSSISPTTPTASSAGYSPFAKFPKSASARRQGRSAPRSPISKSTQPSIGSVDLAVEFEELLATCGELGAGSAVDVDESSSSGSEEDFEAKALRFPLPPLRPAHAVEPRTPPRTSSKLVNWPESPARQIEGRNHDIAPQPMKLSRHAFLQSLSFGESPSGPASPSSPASLSSASSGSGRSSSSSSGRGLPGRKGLPVEWTKFGQPI